MKSIRNLAIVLCLLAVASSPLSAKAEEHQTFQTWQTRVEDSLDRGVMYEKGHWGNYPSWILGNPIVLLDTDAAVWNNGSPEWQQRVIHFFVCEATRWYEINIYPPVAVWVRVRKLANEDNAPNWSDVNNPWSSVYPWYVKTVFRGNISTCS